MLPISQKYCIIFEAALQAKHSFAGCYFCTHIYKEDDIYKLPGKRRKPWAASKTTGWEINTKTNQSKQVKKAIGYFSTRKEALEALTRYNESPYDLFAKEPTFSDVYEAWSDVHFPTLGGPSSVRTITSAYKHCAPISK